MGGYFIVLNRDTLIVEYQGFKADLDGYEEGQATSIVGVCRPPTVLEGEHSVQLQISLTSIFAKTLQITLWAGISAPNISVRYFLRVEWIERIGLIWQTGRWAAVFSETSTCIRLFDFFRIRITALWCSFTLSGLGLCEIDLIPEEKTLVRPECWDNWVVPRLWSGSTVGWQDDYYDVDDNDGECIGNDHHDDANAKPVWYWRPSQ